MVACGINKNLHTAGRNSLRPYISRFEPNIMQFADFENGTGARLYAILHAVDALGLVRFAIGIKGDAPLLDETTGFTFTGCQPGLDNEREYIGWLAESIVRYISRQFVLRELAQ